MPSIYKAVLCKKIILLTYILHNDTVPGMDFMQTIYNNIGRMSLQFQHMNRDIFARAQAGRRFGPGATRFRTADGGTGFVYK